jgi:hypothetical protein
LADARDSPPHQCGLIYPADCSAQSRDGCIISALSNQTAAFLSPDTFARERKEALMFILHFFGDLHQPLHIENAYRGGNEIPVCFRKACARTNLHSVWDTLIPDKIVGLGSAPTHPELKVAAAVWAEQLHGAALANAGVAGVDPMAECHDLMAPDSCSVNWAAESNAWVCKYVMKEGLEWLSSNDLSLDYYDGAKPIVEELISKAGLRLAGWLEAMVAAAATSNSGVQQPVSNMEL